MAEPTETETTTTLEENSGASIRDAIAAAVSSQPAEEPAPEVEPAPPAETEPPATDAAQDPTEDQGAPAEFEAALELLANQGKADTAPAADTAIIDMDVDRTPSEQLAAPADWSDADRSVFDGQTSDVKRLMLRQYKTWASAKAPAAEQPTPMAEVVDRWNPYFQQLNTTPEQAVDVLVRTEYTLRNGTPTDKANVILNLMQQYGIHPNTLAAPGADATPAAPSALPGAQTDAVDPEINAALQPLTERVEALTTGFNGFMTQRQQQDSAAAAERIRTFAEAKDDKGRPLHPFFAEVEGKMVELATLERSQGRQPDLEQLYSNACFATPHIRQQIVDHQTRQQALAQQADMKRRVQQAANTASSLPSNTQVAGQQSLSLRDEIKANWAAQS